MMITSLYWVVLILAHCYDFEGHGRVHDRKWKVVFSSVECEPSEYLLVAIVG